MVLEDVHWADRSSRDLLRYLLARLVDEPVTVVASYRADDLHRRHPLRPLLAELVRLPGVERIELAPLPDADVGALVRGLAATDGRAVRGGGRGRRRPRRGQRLLRRGAGGGRAARRGAAARADRRPAGPGGAALAGRAAGAADRRRGRPAGAARAGGRGRRPGAGELEDALAEAVHHHLLVVSDDGRYRFRHALLREAVLADLLPGERVRLHALDRRLPGRDAGRGHGGRAGPPRPGEQRPARRVQRLAGGGRGRLLGRCAGRAAPAPGGGARAVAGGARRRRAGRPRPGRRCWWRPRPPRARWARCTGRWRCCARRCDELGPDADPVARARVALHARPGDGPGRGRRRRPPREQRGHGAGPGPAAVARCAPGQRPRTRG